MTARISKLPYHAHSLIPRTLPHRSGLALSQTFSAVTVDVAVRQVRNRTRLIRPRHDDEEEGEEERLHDVLPEQQQP